MTPPAGPVARIDLSALVHNFHEVERLVGRAVDVLAMVKADAYGHGAVEVTRALVGAGCRIFGVATLDEASQLFQRAGLTARARVLVFGGLLPAYAERAVELGVEVVTHEADVVRALGAAAVAAGRDVAIHVKVDTGMHRLGVAPEDVPEFLSVIGATRGVRAVALCSHFALAESVSTDVTAGQLERLIAASRAAAAVGEPLARHLANSAAIMTCKDAHLEMVRPGLMLYGLYPDASLHGRANLRRVMTLHAPVVRVADVAADEGIGYGHTYRTSVPAKIATLRCGYADGYPRALSNRGTVLFSGGTAPVVGRVCMDHVMVDVSAVGPVRVGDVAVMWGPELPTEDVAAAAGTISYELVARVGARVVRQYVGS